jgi:hypothetical protein
MQKVGIMGRMGLGALLGSALAHSLMQGVQSIAPAGPRQHRVAPNITRQRWYSGRHDHKASKKPGQTDAQAAQALATAQAKRDRKAVALTRWAERSTEGALAWRLARTGGATY